MVPIIYINKPADLDLLKSIIHKVITRNQYHDTDLSKENFVMVV